MVYDYNHLNDASIPENRKKLEEEIASLDKPGQKLAIDSPESDRFSFLCTIKGVLDDSPLTLDSLRDCSPQEIEDLCDLFSPDIISDLPDLKEIYNRSRDKLRKIILFQVLKLNADDLRRLLDS